MERPFKKVFFLLVYNRICIFMSLKKVFVIRDNYFVHQNHSFPGKKLTWLKKIN